MLLRIDKDKYAKEFNTQSYSINMSESLKRGYGWGFHMFKPSFNIWECRREIMVGWWLYCMDDDC
jgi:hypothetical protein